MGCHNDRSRSPYISFCFNTTNSAKPKQCSNNPTSTIYQSKYIPHGLQNKIHENSCRLTPSPQSRKQIRSRGAGSSRPSTIITKPPNKYSNGNQGDHIMALIIPPPKRRRQILSSFRQRSGGNKQSAHAPPRTMLLPACPPCASAAAHQRPLFGRRHRRGVPHRQQLFGGKPPASAAPAFALPCCFAFAPLRALLRQEAALAEYSQCRKGLAPLKPAPHRDRAGQASSYALLAAGFCSCGSGVASKPQAISLCNLIINTKLLANCFEFSCNP